MICPICSNTLVKIDKKNKYFCPSFVGQFEGDGTNHFIIQPGRHIHVRIFDLIININIDNYFMINNLSDLYSGSSDFSQICLFKVFMNDFNKNYYNNINNFLKFSSKEELLYKVKLLISFS